jgi:hypothetical protein
MVCLIVAFDGHGVEGDNESSAGDKPTTEGQKKLG